MNKTQKTYAIAKAAYEVAAVEKATRLHPFDNLLDGNDDDIAKYTDLEMQFNAELNLDVLRSNLRQAEDQMIVWAMNKVSKSRHFTSQHAATYAEIKANMHLGSIRHQMIEISFKLG